MRLQLQTISDVHLELSLFSYQMYNMYNFNLPTPKQNTPEVVTTGVLKIGEVG